MSAYVIVTGTVTDPDKMQEYGAAAGPLGQPLSLSTG